MRLRLILSVLIVIMVAAACGGAEGDSQRKRAVSGRLDTFDGATARYPDPRPQNFPLRGALVKMTERQDLENHPWYIYILGMDGNVIGYYVGQTVPINACNFLSSSEDVFDGGQNDFVTTAPSLDGMFYGNAACDAWFFFDAATDALIQIRGTNFYAADQPLLLDAEPISVDQP
jgi:hypothetical protein